MYLTQVSARRRRLQAIVEAAAGAEDAVPPIEEATETAASTIDRAAPAIERDPRRTNRRLGVSAEVGVRKAGGFSFQLRAFDLSCDGCKVELVEAVDTSERVIVRLPALEPLGAEVAWVAGNEAGLRFERPLHPAVFDQLVGRLGACAA